MHVRCFEMATDIVAAGWAPAAFTAASCCAIEALNRKNSW